MPGELKVWSTVHTADPTSAHPQTPTATPSKGRRRRQWAIHAAIVAAMVVGVTAFVSFDKTIELTVDGKTQKVHTFAGTVSGVLAREGIKVTEHDSVVPPLDRQVAEGQRIAIRFGRPIDLDVDGSTRRVWVTATSVNEALGELGLRDDNMYVSASRSAGIGREGLQLRVLTPRDVTRHRRRQDPRAVDGRDQRPPGAARGRHLARLARRGRPQARRRPEGRRDDPRRARRGPPDHGEDRDPLQGPRDQGPLDVPR